MLHQDFTIFAIDDDLVPLTGFGTVETRENLALWSRDLTNGVWTGDATTVFNQVGLLGLPVTASLVTDSSAVAARIKQQAITIPDNTDPVMAAFWIAKDTDATRFPMVGLALSGGTDKAQNVAVDTTSGAYQKDGDVGGGGVVTVTESRDGLWWIVTVVVVNNGSGNVTATLSIYPARRATLAGANDVAVLGSIVIGNAHLEVNVETVYVAIITEATSVETAAEITEASFSTDPTHPRPYLRFNPDEGETEVDFIDGSAVIAQTAVEVTDARTIANDQDSGIVTGLLASAGGDSALIGVRCVRRQQRIDGTWRIAFDGVCNFVRLKESFAAYRFELRDPRERERQLRLFNRPNTGTAIFPVVGAKEGFGFNTEYDDTTGGYIQTGSPVMPRVLGAYGTFRKAVATPGPGIGVQSGVIVNSPIQTDDYRKLLLDMGAGVPNNPITDPDDISGAWQQTYTFKNVLVEWSPDGTPGSYKQVGPIRLGALLSARNIFDIRKKESKGTGAVGQDSYYVFLVMLECTAAEISDGKEPADGQNVYVRVVSNTEPSEQVPQFIEEPFGTLLKKCYDGDYTIPGTVIPTRYNADRMSVLALTTPYAVIRVTEPVNEGRGWIQSQVYRPMLMAPIIVDGEVYPLSYEIPDETAEYVTLNDSNTIRADWGHGADRVVNQVIIEYTRELVPTSRPQFEEPRTQRIIIERDRLTEDSQRRHGTRPVTYNPDTLRSVVSEAIAFTRIPAEETGGQVAARLSHELLRRFTNGAQEIVSTHPRDAIIDALREGDWVIHGESWLPDYVSGRRGINRLAQIIQIKKDTPSHLGFVALDAGPYLVPIAQPAIDTLTENTDGSVTISITGIAAGARAEVQYAIGESEPFATSGQWKLVDYLDADGDVKTLPHLWPGRLVWVRVRGTAYGRIASAWTTAESIRLDDLALIREATVRVENTTTSADYGYPVVTWEPLDGTAGVKVYWEIHEAGVTPTSLTNDADFDADDESAVLPDAVAIGQAITVQIVGYPGYSAGAVSGSAGSASGWLTTIFIPNRDHPLFAQVTVAVEPDGSVVFNADGVDGVRSHIWYTDTSDFPDLPTTLASGTAEDGQDIAVTMAAGTLDLGETLYGTIVSFDDLGGAGNHGPPVHFKITRHDIPLSKILEFGAFTFGPRSPSVATDFEVVLGYARVSATAPVSGGQHSAQLIANVVLPDGVELTSCDIDVYVLAVAGATASVDCALYRADPDGTTHLLGSNSAVSGIAPDGWQTITFSLSEDTTDRRYFLRINMAYGTAGGSAVDDARCSGYQIAYDSPSTRNNI